jgi:hypothetical protein
MSDAKSIPDFREVPYISYTTLWPNFLPSDMAKYENKRKPENVQ